MIHPTLGHHKGSWLGGDLGHFAPPGQMATPTSIKKVTKNGLSEGFSILAHAVHCHLNTRVSQRA